MAMDWFSWLSKTGLDSSLVYEYGLSFTENQLEEDDVVYFNHEFLQSMGISIAKHRLEILKLATKEKRPSYPLSTIIIAIKRTKTRFSKYLRHWARREDSNSGALALVPKRSYSSRWKSAMLRRNKGVVKRSRAPLLLTNGTPLFFHSSRIGSFSSPVVADDDHPVERDDHREMEGEGCGDEYYLPSVVEDIRWDAMFENLKPT